METPVGSLHPHNRPKRGGKQSDIENFLNFFVLIGLAAFRTPATAQLVANGAPTN